MYVPFSLLLLSLTLTIPSFAGDIVWQKEYDKAVELSQKEHKPILLFFPSAEEEIYSNKMKREILCQPDFIAKCGNSFIFVEIDGNRNSPIKEELHVVELPRLILLDEKRREVIRLGYCEDSGEKLAEKLLRPLQKSRDLSFAITRLDTLLAFPAELEKLYELALELKRGEEASLILEKGSNCSKPLFFLIEKYRLLAEKGCEKEKLKVRSKVLEIDPHNSQEALLSLALIDFQTLASSENAQIHEVIRPLEEYVEKYGKSDPKNCWRLEMMISQFYLNYDDWALSLNHAERAFQAAPQEMQREIAPCLNYLKAQYGQMAHNQ